MDMGPLSRLHKYTLVHDQLHQGAQVTYYGTRHELGASWLVITQLDGTVVAFPRERVHWLRVEDSQPVLSLPAQDVQVISASRGVIGHPNSHLSGYGRNTIYKVKHLPTGITAEAWGRANAFRELHRQLFELGYDVNGNPPPVKPAEPADDPGYEPPAEELPSMGQRLRNLVIRGGIDGA
jgi:hypothetical protein